MAWHFYSWGWNLKIRKFCFVTKYFHKTFKICTSKFPFALNVNNVYLWRRRKFSSLRLRPWIDTCWISTVELRGTSHRTGVVQLTRSWWLPNGGWDCGIRNAWGWRRLRRTSDLPKKNNKQLFSMWTRLKIHYVNPISLTILGVWLTPIAFFSASEDFVSWLINCCWLAVFESTVGLPCSNIPRSNLLNRRLIVLCHSCV